jgi:hypothetical protein
MTAIYHGVKDYFYTLSAPNLNLHVRKLCSLHLSSAYWFLSNCSLLSRTSSGRTPASASNVAMSQTS